jgi:hypothetical protein
VLAGLVHPDYLDNAAKWERTRDVIAGEDAIKDGGTKYLPRLDSQSDAEYSDYTTRSIFFNATARTLDGFIGLIFRKPSELIFNVSSRESDLFQNDLDLEGNNLDAYAKKVCAEVISLGRGGTLIDWNSQESRPYLAFYSAENILDWETIRIDGRPTLNRVLLRENAERITHQEGPQQRRRAYERLRDVRITDKGVLMETWEISEGKWTLTSDSILSRKGKPLTRIPFVFHSANNIGPAVQKSPVEDLVTVNLDHYRLSADYRHGIHYTALPTAWVAGFDKEAVLRIGSGTAWVTEQTGAAAGYLEFTGQGLETFERALDRDERIMAVLGSRMLEQTKKVAESAEAIRIRQMSEGSLLAGIIISVNHSLTKCFQWAAWWFGNAEAPESVSPNTALATLNLDYQTAGLTSMEIIAIVQAWQTGALNREQMEGVFRQGELLPPRSSNDSPSDKSPEFHPDSNAAANLAVNLNTN